MCNKILDMTSIASLSPSQANLAAPGYMAGPYNMVAYGVLWFIVIAVIVWFVLYALKPAFVQNCNALGQPDGCVSPARVLLWAILIALLIVIIIWLLRALLSAGRC